MTDTQPYVDEAIAIADRIAAQAIHHRAACNWIVRPPALTSVTRSDAHPHMRTLQSSMYEGTAGIALALARISRFSGDPEHRRVAGAALEHALVEMRARRDRASSIWTTHRFGFYSGMLGIAFVAHELARELGEEAYARGCRAIVRELSVSIGTKHETDVMFGNAGAIPTLLAMSDAGVDDAFDLAVDLGDELCRLAQAESKGGHSWPSEFARRRRMPNYLGFSHGVAGIGWALTMLHRRTKQGEHARMAKEAFEWERANFYHDVGNWPHFDKSPGDDGRYHCSVAWCHGAAGIGVSRVLTHQLRREARLLDEARIARDTTRRDLARRVEHPGVDVTLCHGTLGTAECLAMTEAALGTDGWRDAREVADYVLERYGPMARKRWGALEYPTGSAGVAPPGLLTGMAGVAYFLLRCHDPVRVPSLLVPGLRMA